MTETQQQTNRASASPELPQQNDDEDAARFRWLVETDPEAVAMIAWRVRAACAHEDPRKAIDAAMKKRKKK